MRAVYTPLSIHRMTAKCVALLPIALLMVSVFRPLAAQASPFQRLDSAGRPQSTADRPWACVQDLRTGLVWEVKTDDGGPHDGRRTFTWAPTPPLGEACTKPPCDVQGLLRQVNREGWCGRHHWRLPRREELRTLVDYARPAPANLIVDPALFPHNQRGFYWAAETAADPDEAWGIGFTFGFDYAYFKTDRVYLRLVHAAEMP